ncbi:MAG TPA: ATP-binding protein [Bdellovibrionota bacterium]|nr:ATP-binding protein [Bdellovibrionota bacterium]
MMDSERNTPITQMEAEDRKIKLVGTMLCLSAIPLNLCAAILESTWGSTLIGWMDLLAMLSCIVSVLWSRSSCESGRYVWYPAICGVWLASIPAIYSTGGASSPYFSPYLILLLLISAILHSKNRFHIPIIFVLLNLAAWALVSRLGVIPPPSNIGNFVTITRTGIFLAAVYVFIAVLFQSQRKLIEEILQRTRELHETKSRLIHTAKLAEIGNLLAATAHELGQPTQVIVTASSLLSQSSHRGILTPENARHLSYKIGDSAKRIVRLLSYLRDFSRKDALMTETIDMSESLRAIQILTEHDLKSKNIRFTLEIPDRALWVCGDSIKIQQVLFNLIANARDACLKETEPKITVRAEQLPQWIRISVTNNGPQIPVRLWARLFEPYFTTKPTGTGTGLGLPICQDLISQHKGRIFFSSEHDCTVFIVDLPQYPHTAPASRSREAPSCVSAVHE